MNMKVLHLSKTDKIGGAFVATYRIHQALRKKNVESYMWVDEKRTNDKTIISQKVQSEWPTQTQQRQKRGTSTSQ